MAISKRKGPEQSKPSKRSKTSTSKKTSRSPSAQSEKRSPSKKISRESRRSDPPSRSARSVGDDLELTALELALSDAREQIELLTEDRDNQVAILEAAEIDHSIVLAQLEEAKQRIAQLESQRHGVAIQGAASPSVPQEEEIHFDDEETLQPDPDDLDDVDSIYDQMDDPRVRRQELDRERLDRESEAGDEPYWNVCPKCGDRLEEIEAEDLKIDRCESCGGIFLDHGEIELLLLISRGKDGMERIRSALQM